MPPRRVSTWLKPSRALSSRKLGQRIMVGNEAFAVKHKGAVWWGVYQRDGIWALFKKKKHAEQYIVQQNTQIFIARAERDAARAADHE